MVLARNLFLQIRFVTGSVLGSQFKSFLFNVSPTEHAGCLATSGRRLKFGITHPYPNLPHSWTLGYPQPPPVLRECPAQSGAPVAPAPRELVGRADSPSRGATWARRART